MRQNCIQLSCVVQAMCAVTILRRENLKWAGNDEYFLSKWNRLSFAWTKKQRYLTAAYTLCCLKYQRSMRLRQLWGLSHLPPYLVFIQDAALTLMTTAFLTSELLKILRGFWRWNGRLIQIPMWPPFPVMLLRPPGLVTVFVLSEGGLDSWTRGTRAKWEIFEIFFSWQCSRLTAEVIIERTGARASTVYLWSLCIIRFDQFDSVAQVLWGPVLNKAL